MFLIYYYSTILIIAHLNLIEHTYVITRVMTQKTISAVKIFVLLFARIRE